MGVESNRGLRQMPIHRIESDGTFLRVWRDKNNYRELVFAQFAGGNSQKAEAVQVAAQGFIDPDITVSLWWGRYENEDTSDPEHFCWRFTRT